MLDADMIKFHVNVHVVSYGGIVLLPCTCKKKLICQFVTSWCLFMLSVTYVDLSEQYVDLSEQYVDLSGKHHQH